LFTDAVGATATKAAAEGIKAKKEEEAKNGAVEDDQTVVLRFDNIAWVSAARRYMIPEQGLTVGFTQDMTPEYIKAFIPENSLPIGHMQPVHLLIDRMNGKMKDYCVSCFPAVVRPLAIAHRWPTPFSVCRDPEHVRCSQDHPEQAESRPRYR
jgi:hypothetical protein